jgi:programmed cell death 8 (apoptosis-inducing factor)
MLIYTYTRVSSIDVSSKRVSLSDGRIVRFDKLLIASGGTPNSLSNNPKVTTYRTLQDFWRLRQVTEKAQQIVVVGGGFLGSELAASIASRAKATGSPLKVIQVFPESGIMALNFPKYLSDHTTETIKKGNFQQKRILTHTEYGVHYDIRPERFVKDFTDSPDGKVVVRLDTGENIVADHVGE